MLLRRRNLGRDRRRRPGSGDLDRGGWHAGSRRGSLHWRRRLSWRGLCGCDLHYRWRGRRHWRWLRGRGHHRCFDTLPGERRTDRFRLHRTRGDGSDWRGGYGSRLGLRLGLFHRCGWLHWGGSLLDAGLNHLGFVPFFPVFPFFFVPFFPFFKDGFARLCD